LSVILGGVTRAAPSAYAAVEVAQPPTDVLRRPGDHRASRRVRFCGALDQIGLGHAPGKDGCRETSGLRGTQPACQAPALVVGVAPIPGRFRLRLVLLVLLRRSALGP